MRPGVGQQGGRGETAKWGLRENPGSAVGAASIWRRSTETTTRVDGMCRRGRWCASALQCQISSSEFGRAEDVTKWPSSRSQLRPKTPARSVLAGFPSRVSEGRPSHAAKTRPLRIWRRSFFRSHRLEISVDAMQVKAPSTVLKKQLSLPYLFTQGQTKRWAFACSSEDLLPGLKPRSDCLFRYCITVLWKARMVV
jgi:hypothetical protein